MEVSKQPRPNYGLDAPGLVRGFFFAGLAALAIAAGLLLVGGWGRYVAGATAFASLYAFGMGLYMVFWSRVVKVRRREGLLDRIVWKGDEVVLDVGCGRGLLAVAAARRAPDGGVVGVDIWQETDQAGNRPEAALENARREGVADRVSVETADARSLPCQTGSFDVVVSHWVVHNIPGRAGRETALGEMTRVLKPGGTLLIADIARHAEYEAHLTRLGLTDVRRISPGWLGRLSMVLSFGSFYPAAVVARKLG